MKRNLPEMKIVSIVIAYIALALASCGTFEDMQRRQLEAERDFEMRFREVKLGMSVAEVETLLGGPPFRTEPTIGISGTTEMRYYNLIYLKMRPMLKPEGAYYYRPGNPILWMKFDDGRLTSYGVR